MQAREKTDTADLKPKSVSTAADEKNGIGFVSVANKRSYHEDRVSAMLMQEREKYTLKQWDYAFIRAVSELQSDVQRDKHKGGSTLCCVVADGSHRLRVCNIGDSMSYIVIIDNKGKNIPITLKQHDIVEEKNANVRRHQHIIYLNNQHKPEILVGSNTKFSELDQKLFRESHKIFLAGGTVTRNKPGGDLRTNGIVNMSRAIGDLSTAKAFKKNNVSVFHQPSKFHYNIVWPADWKERGLEAFAIVVTDGVCDSRRFNPDQLAAIVAKWNRQISLAEIANKIVEYAASGTTDNISVGLMKITPELKQIRSVMVADGHGGHRVVDHVNAHFYDKLQSKLNKIAIKEIHPHADGFFAALEALITYDTAALEESSFKHSMLSLKAACLGSNGQSHDVRRKAWIKLFCSLKTNITESNFHERYEPFYLALKNEDWGNKQQIDAIALMQQLRSLASAGTTKIAANLKLFRPGEEQVNDSLQDTQVDNVSAVCK